jgi:hypothetical protein
MGVGKDILLDLAEFYYEFSPCKREKVDVVYEDEERSGLVRGESHRNGK